MTNNNDAADLFNGPQLESYQAQRIIDKFGGVPKLVAALEFVGRPISRFSVYKWTYPKIKSGQGGTGGIVPPQSVPWVKQAARELGIDLLPSDWAK